MSSSRIEWVSPPGYKPAVLHLTAGCTPISEGCLHCWAARMASRNLPRLKFFKGLTKDGKWTGQIRYNADRQVALNKWREPHCIFVCPMSDLFHEKVPDELITSILYGALISQGQIFQFLTKRAARMAAIVAQFETYFGQVPQAAWFGVSIENGKRWQDRVWRLRDMPAKIRFVSCEPLLGILNLQPFHLRDIDWVIIGCESLAGRAGRFCENEPRFYEAARRIVDVCRQAGTKVFVKQLPIGGKVARNPADFPQDLQIREFAI